MYPPTKPVTPVELSIVMYGLGLILVLIGLTALFLPWIHPEAAEALTDLRMRYAFGGLGIGLFIIVTWRLIRKFLSQ